MSNKQTKPLVPELRFPEFRGDGVWRATPLGELGAIVTGKTPSTKEEDLWGGDIPFITPTDITEGEKFQYSTQRTVFKTTGTKILPPGSVVYTCIASIGKMALTVVPSVTNQQINAVVPNGKTAREFIYYSLANLTPWIKSIPATSTLPIINKSQFSEFIIPHPAEKDEQQKIADCLSSLDELIAAQARRVRALKTHKKGLMQRLFPGGGETQPRLRFPECKGQWNDATLGELCFNVSSGKDARHSDGVFDLYGSTGVIGKTAKASYQTPHILVARVGANAGYLTKANGQFGVTDNTLVINLKPAANIDYIFHYLGNININKLIFGSGQPLITGSILKAQRVLLPPTEEQIKIAKCLSSVSNLIKVESDKLDTLNAQKKGLVQILFPSLEAAAP